METSPTGIPGDSMSVTIPASITGSDRDAAEHAVAVWRHAMGVYDASMSDPGGQDWAAALHQYVNDPAASQQLALLDSFATHGLHKIGTTRYDATVTAASDHNVQLSACVDVSDSSIVDEAGNSAAGDGPVRFQWTFNIDFYPNDPGQWFLNDVTKPDPSTPC